MSPWDVASAVLLVAVGVIRLVQLRTKPADLDAVKRLAEERCLAVQSVRRKSIFRWRGSASPYLLSSMGRAFEVIAISPNGERRKLLLGTDPLGTSGQMQVFQDDAA